MSGATFENKSAITSHRSGGPHAVITTRPPGRATRTISRMAAPMSAAHKMLLTAVTASKLPSANGSASRQANPAKAGLYPHTHQLERDVLRHLVVFVRRE